MAPTELQPEEGEIVHAPPNQPSRRVDSAPTAASAETASPDPVAVTVEQDVGKPGAAGFAPGRAEDKRLSSSVDPAMKAPAMETSAKSSTASSGKEFPSSVTRNANATFPSNNGFSTQFPSGIESNNSPDDESRFIVTNDDNKHRKQSAAGTEQMRSSNSRPKSMKPSQQTQDNISKIPTPTSPQHLHDLIQSSRDKLFFISFSLQGKSEIIKLKSTPTKNEWYLVRVDLNICQSIEETKNCRETGFYYVDFYSKAGYDKGILIPGGDSKKVAAEVMPDSHSRWWLEWHEFQFRRGEMVLGKAKEFDPNGGKAIAERLVQLLERDKNEHCKDNDDDDDHDHHDDDDDDDDQDHQQHPFWPEFHPNLDKYTTWADTVNLMDENIRLLGPFDFQDAKPTDIQFDTTVLSPIHHLEVGNEVMNATLINRFSDLYVRERVPLQRWRELLRVIQERGLNVTHPTVGWNKKRRCGTCAECTKPDCNQCNICLNKIQLSKDGVSRRGNKYGCKRRGRCLKMDDAAVGVANSTANPSAIANDIDSPADGIPRTSISNESTPQAQGGYQTHEIKGTPTGEKVEISSASTTYLPRETNVTPDPAPPHDTEKGLITQNVSAFEEGGFYLCHNCGRGDTDSNPTLSFPDTRTKPSLHIHKSCAQTQNIAIREEDVLELVKIAMNETRRASLKGEGDFFLIDELKAKLYQTLDTYHHKDRDEKSLSRDDANEDTCNVAEVVAKNTDSAAKVDEGVENQTTEHIQEPLIGLPLSETTVEDIDSFPVVFAYYSQHDDPSGISEENAKVAQLDFEMERKRQKRSVIYVEGNKETSPISTGAGSKRRRTKNSTPNPTMKGEIAIKYNFPTGESLAEFPTQPAVDLPEGWTARIIPRSNGEKTDTYYFSPNLGFKFRSKPEVHRFLAVLSECGGDEGMAVLTFKKN